MSKQIIPRELAELVSGLLISPEVLGELETPEQHRMFIEDIGRVVAQHCGGQINGCSLGDNHDTASAEAALPMLSVSPCETLPSLRDNIWDLYDPEGWDDEEADYHGIELGTRKSAKLIGGLRSLLRGLMANEALASDEPQGLEWSMIDWRIDEDPSITPAADEKYFVEAAISNQSRFNITSSDGEPKMSVFLEVSNGVPSLHIEFAGDRELHVMLAQEGLVLTPGDSRLRFEEAAADEFTDFSTAALRVL